MSQDSYELSRTHIQVNMIKGSAETFRIALFVCFYVIIYQILCMYHKTPFIYSKPIFQSFIGCPLQRSQLSL